MNHLRLITALIMLGIIFSISITGEYRQDITMDELQSFLRNDTTNSPFHLYVNGEHMCGHFTRDLIANATNYSIKLYPVGLVARPGHQDHVIAAARINNTIVFIEPQTDEIITLEMIKMHYKSHGIGMWVVISPLTGSANVMGIPYGLAGLPAGCSWN